MDNVFIECMVRRDDNTMRIVKKVGMILGLLIFDLIVLLFFTLFFSVALVISCLVVFFFWRRIDREYEYIYTDGLLDIDVIYGRSSRKRLLSADAKEFQFIAPADSKIYHNQLEAKYDKVIDADSGALNERSYVGVLKRDEKTIKLIFEPNERIVNALKRYAPRKFEARA